MLLVLRVFSRDAEVQALFDDVVEAWRYSGPACLIAGTDLALRTLEPDERFTFASGRLQERFIAGEVDLARRLESLDLAADPDGRFRVNEFCCFHSTWRQTLDGLVSRSDVVLMDLRGLRAENLGSLHEYRSTRALEAAIIEYITVTNEQPSPFRWTKTADEILASVERFCRRISDSRD